MALYQVNAGDRILAADINQFYQILKGVAASGEAVTLIYNNQSLIFQPSSDPSAGTRVVLIKNTAGTVLATWRYDGLMELLSAAAAPASAIAGSIYWDSLLSALRVNDGTNWRDIAGNNAGPLPNLVLNSDFSRRTVLGLAMPEVFADLAGTTKIDAGAAGSVASNIFTQGAANNEYAWCAGSFVWRDGRASATFKATAIAGKYTLRFRIDATHFISARNNNGVFELTETQAGVDTVISSSGNVLTINRWYWLELNLQGTTAVAKIYDTTVTTPGTVKGSLAPMATLTQTTTMSNTGCHVSITSDQAAAQWGGIATGNGGVYVETWLPESFSVVFNGTIGGQAIGIDESSDAGPLGRQWAIRGYIPATNRKMEIDFQSAAVGDGKIAPSVSYTTSVYTKVSGKGGSGNLAYMEMYDRDQNGANLHLLAALANDQTSWTRSTGTASSASTGRGWVAALYFNPNSTATGTGYFQYVQLEQGSAATAWRNAPADDAPIVWQLDLPASVTSTSASDVEIDARNLAGNFFFPWDCSIRTELRLTLSNSGANTMEGTVYVDGLASGEVVYYQATVAAAILGCMGATINRTTAGKHRITAEWKTTAGTATAYGTAAGSHLILTATRGK